MRMLRSQNTTTLNICSFKNEILQSSHRPINYDQQYLHETEMSVIQMTPLVSLYLSGLGGNTRLKSSRFFSDCGM